MLNPSKESEESDGAGALVDAGEQLNAGALVDVGEQLKPGEQLEARLQPRIHDGYRMVEPARPDLQPGQSVTYTPDRYCEKCEQPRGVKRCPICGETTVMAAERAETEPPELAGGAAPLELEPAEPPALELPDAGAVPELVPGLVPRTRRRVIDDIEPPPDPELDTLIAASEPLPAPPAAPRPRSEPVPRGSIGSMIDRALAARDAEANAERYVLEHARELDRAHQQRQTAAAGSASNGHAVDTRSAPRQPAFVTRANAPTRGGSVLSLPRLHTVSGSRTAGQGRATMQTTRTIERELDDGGREVHRTSRSGRKRSIEDQLLDLWQNAKIDKAHWVQFAAAYARSGSEPSEAADLADQLYMELIQREQLALSR